MSAEDYDTEYGGAYEWNDPKNPAFVGAMFDWADDIRKKRKESSEFLGPGEHIAADEYEQHLEEVKGWGEEDRG